MGRVRYKYPFEQLPTIDEIAQCFHELTGLVLNAEQISGNTWDLSLRGLKGEAEIERDGNVLWVIPSHPYWFRTSYFMQALKRVLHHLGAQRPAPRIRRYARVPWAQIPWYRKRLHG